MSDPFEKLGFSDPFSNFWYTSKDELSYGLIRVTPETSKLFSAYWAATNLYAIPISNFDRYFQEISQDEGSEYPRDVYRNDRNHHLWRLFDLEVNPHTSTTSWMYETVDHFINWGNSFDLVERRNERIENLWKIHPSRIPRENIIEFNSRTAEKLFTTYPTLRRMNPKMGEHVYRVSADPNSNEDKEFVILERNMLHIMRCPHGGYGQGVHAISKGVLQRQFSANKYEQDFFDNGGFNSVVVTYPEGIEGDARAEFRNSVKARVGITGVSSQEPLFLEYGSDAHALSVSPDAAKLIETKNYNIEDMARNYQVPLHMLARMNNVSYNSIEQQFSEYLITALQPTVKTICLELRRQLLGRSIQSKRRFHIDVRKDVLLSDLKSHAEYLHKLFQTGAVSPNDICEEIGKNPFGSEGDSRYAQVNVQLLDQFNTKLELDKAKIETEKQTQENLAAPPEPTPSPTESEDQPIDNEIINKQAKTVLSQSIKNTFAFHNRKVIQSKMDSEQYNMFVESRVEDIAKRVITENQELIHTFTDWSLEDAATHLMTNIKNKTKHCIETNQYDSLDTDLAKVIDNAVNEIFS